MTAGIRNPVNLGKVLAAARKSCNLTQQELCAHTGIAYSTLTKIERGAIKKPNVFTVFKIAQITKLSIEDLLNSQAYLTNNSKDSQSDNQIAQLNQKQLVAKSSIKFVYFDLHQVLVNSTSVVLPMIASHFKIAPAVVEDLFFRYNEKLCRGQVLPAEFVQIFVDRYGGSAINWQDFYLQAITIHPVALQTCLKLMEYLPVGLLTNCLAGNVSSLIEHKILPGNFAAIVDSSEVGLCKPDSEIYQYATKASGVPPEQILLIDDRLVNVLAAQKQGWQAFQFNPDNPQLFANYITQEFGI